MNEPITLEVAQDVLERTRQSRPFCSGCTVISIAGPWFRLSQGEPQPFDGLQAALNRAAREHLAGQDWEQSADHATADGGDVFTKRCEKCAVSKSFPWADRLDAERVRKFMQDRIDAAPNGEAGAFWLGELEALV